MKKDFIPSNIQKIPDYKALALLLIDLFEEKREIEQKIAFIKEMLLD